jgi:hypothetical protein
MFRHSTISLARRSVGRRRWMPTTNSSRYQACSSSIRLFSSQAQPQQQPQLSKQEIHEQSVAAARALREERQQRHEEAHKTYRARRSEAPKRHALVNSIQHWLSKDPAFLTATMEALNLNLDVVSKPGDIVDHPFYGVWKQYRQLYHDTIPAFREQFKENPSSAMETVVSELEEAGFDDQHWAKRFRQYRGYNIQRSGLARSLAKAEADLEERGKTMLDQENKLKLLLRRVRTEQERIEKMAREKEEEEVRRKESESVFSKVFSTLTSFLPFSVEKEGDTTSNTRKDWTEQLFGSTRDQRRILKKKSLLNDIEQEVLDAGIKVANTKAEIIRLKPPMSDDEYNRALETVGKVRSVICEEMASQIRHRHAELIAQYQTLDDKTGKFSCIVRP